MNYKMKWLWNDYEFMYEICRRLIWNALWNDYEMMIWIDYELSDLNYVTSMKKYEFMYEKVWIDVWKSIFQQACTWKCMKKYQHAHNMKM